MLHHGFKCVYITRKSQIIISERRFSNSNVLYAKGNKAIRTLDPNRLQPEDFLDLTARKAFHVYLIQRNTVKTSHQLRYNNSANVPFPDATQGFLYFHHDPILPPGYGEIRFRVTKSPDPAAFEHGTDLRDPSGRIWRRRQRTNAAAVRRLLVTDGLVLPSDRFNRANDISTFRPELLKSTDFVDFSGRGAIGVWTKYGRAEFYCRPGGFPDNARGFLYYHHPPNTSPACGEIRLRVTGERETSLFQQGSDLMLSSGVPWRVTLPHISRFDPIKQLLLDEGLVAPSLLSMIEAMHPKDATHSSSLGLNLFSIDQPWTFNVAHTKELYVNSNRSVSCGFDLTWDNFISAFPYTGKNLSNILTFPSVNIRPGKVIGRLEPGKAVGGALCVKFRVLEIVEPVRCIIPNYSGRVAIPKVGELLSTVFNGKFRPRKIFVTGKRPRGSCLLELLPASLKVCPPNLACMAFASRLTNAE